MLLRLTTAALALSAAMPAFAQDKGTVNIYNWSDYIDPELLTQFTKETGIKVNLVTAGAYAYLGGMPMMMITEIGAKNGRGWPARSWARK